MVNFNISHLNYSYQGFPSSLASLYIAYLTVFTNHQTTENQALLQLLFILTSHPWLKLIFTGYCIIYQKKDREEVGVGGSKTRDFIDK